MDEGNQVAASSSILLKKKKVGQAKKRRKAGTNDGNELAGEDQLALTEEGIIDMTEEGIIDNDDWIDRELQNFLNPLHSEYSRETELPQLDLSNTYDYFDAANGKDLIDWLNENTKK